MNSLDPAAYVGSFTVKAENSGRPEVYSVDVTDYVRSHLADGGVSFLLADAAQTGVSVNIYTKEANGSSNQGLCWS